MAQSRASDIIMSALAVAEHALAGLAEDFSYDEDDGPEMPCYAKTLCGERVCEQVGCIRDKRDACREAIAHLNTKKGLRG